MAGPDDDHLLAQVRDAAATLWIELQPTPTSVTVRNGEVEVRLELGAPTAPDVAPVAPAATVVPSVAHYNGAGRPAVEAAEPAAGTDPDQCVCAPLVGMFYRAPGPDEAPFVSPGDRIEKGQQVGIIEAMKLMVPVESTRTGRVTTFLVGDGEPVEYATPLLVVSDG